MYEGMNVARRMCFVCFKASLKRDFRVNSCNSVILIGHSTHNDYQHNKGGIR